MATKMFQTTTRVKAVVVGLCSCTIVRVAMFSVSPVRVPMFSVSHVLLMTFSHAI